MRWRWLLALTFVVGCGRYGFDPVERTDDGGPNGDARDAGQLGPLKTAYFKAPNNEVFDQFGYAVALSSDGTTLAITSIFEDCATTTINGNQTNNAALQAGAVFVFNRLGDVWQLQAYLKPQAIDINDVFGTSLAISADGNTLAVGMPGDDSAATTIGGNAADNSAMDAGSVIIFKRTSGAWAQEAYIKASNAEAGDQLGDAVALSADGDTLAVGAAFEDGGTTGVGGNESSNTAMDAGAVYMFTRAGSTWSQAAYIKASNTDVDDEFGSAVALSTDAATLVVGAPLEDSGATIATATSTLAGSEADDSVVSGGAVYVFVRNGNWAQQAYLKPSNIDFGDFFGHAVGLSANGSSLVVTSPGEDGITPNSGGAYAFTRAGTTWTALQKLKASNAGDNDQYGASVAMSGDGARLDIGSPDEDSNAIGLDGDQTNDGRSDSGAVYMYAMVGGIWSQDHYGKGPASTNGDEWGSAVAISGDGLTNASGAHTEDSDAVMINGDPVNDNSPDSGAVILTYY